MSPVTLNGQRAVSWDTFTRFRRHLIVAYLILAGFLVATSYLSWRSANDQTNQICQASLSARRTLRDLVIRARTASEHNPQATPEQRRQAERFYTDALRRIPTTPCP